MSARPVALYRHFDGQDRLLYVGVTANPLQRICDHNAHSPWFLLVARTVYEWHPDRVSAEDAETTAIQTEAPLHNVRVSVGHPRGPYRDRNENLTTLSRWLSASKIPQSDLAAQVGVTQPTISRFASGTMKPSLAVAMMLERATDGAVPVDVWAAE